MTVKDWSDFALTCLGEDRDRPTVHNLLAAPEVEAFKKHNWGGGPVPMFYGTTALTNENVEAWER